MDWSPALQGLPDVEPATAEADWLVHPVASRATVSRDGDTGLALGNGLLRRAFRLQPNAATVALDNLTTDQAVLRSVSPEARVGLDGADFDVGGLVGQVEHGYLRREWLDDLRGDPQAFQCRSLDTGPTVAPFPWRRKRYSADGAWPPPGVRLSLRFSARRPI